MINNLGSEIIDGHNISPVNTSISYTVIWNSLKPNLNKNVKPLGTNVLRFSFLHSIKIKFSLFYSPTFALMKTRDVYHRHKQRLKVMYNAGSCAIISRPETNWFTYDDSNVTQTNPCDDRYMAHFIWQFMRARLTLNGF